MPIAYIMTNVTRDKVPFDFKAQAIAMVAEIVGKPENWCCVLISTDMDIRMCGSDEPAVIFVVRANGVFNGATNGPLFGKAAVFFKQSLGVKECRTYSEFSERDVDFCGIGGFSIRQCMAQCSGAGKEEKKAD